MAILFEKKVRDYIKNFSDEMIVTVFDAQIGLTVASLKVKELKEKKIFDDYTVKFFNQYNEDIVLLGVIKSETNTTITKQIS